MADEINFFDVVALTKIKPNTTVEKYGGMLNASFFEGANVVGTLMQKKLISTSTAMPDQNVILLTDGGKALLAEAEERSKGEFDHLDLAILTQIANGKSALPELSKAVNVRPKDLAMHLYKMMKAEYSTYDFISGNLSIMLTEKGFAQVKAGMPVKPMPPAPEGMAQAMPQETSSMEKPMKHPMGVWKKPSDSRMGMPADPNQSMQDPEAAAISDAQPAEPAADPMMDKPKGGKMKWIIIIVIILIIIVGAAYYLYTKGYF